MVSALELEKFHEQTCNKARSLVKIKGKDYSKNADKDTLASIRIFNEWGITQSDAHTALGYALTKISRIRSLLENDSPNFESIDDSIDDLINYTVYCKWFINENKEKNKKGLYWSEENIKGITPGSHIECGKLNMNDISGKETDVKELDISRKEISEIRRSQESNMGNEDEEDEYDDYEEDDYI